MMGDRYNGDVVGNKVCAETTVNIKDETHGENETQEAAPEHRGGHGIDVAHPTSYLETLTHLFKSYIGSGVFAMGDAYKNGGLVFGPIMILFLGVVCIHAQHLLVNCSLQMSKRTKSGTLPDYATTVELCFSTGPPGLRKMAPFMRRLANFFLCITQFGFCCIYFVFISTNIKQVFDYYGYPLDVHYHMAIVVIPILLSSLIRNLKYLAPFSAVANVMMVVGIAITLYFATQDLPPISDRHYVASLHQIPLFFGTVLYAFEGISLVLPLRNVMKKPENFNRPLGVLNVGMAIVVFLFLIVGFFGYYRYGENVKGSLTLNVPQDLLLGQSVKVIISCGILLSYALQFYVPIDILWPGIVEKHGPFKRPVLGELLFRTAFVLMTFFLAEVIPNLGLFISLVGAVSSTALSLLFPPLLEMVSKWTVSGGLHPLTVFKNVGILIIGFAGFATGTYESASELVTAFMEGNF